MNSAGSDGAQAAGGRNNGKGLRHFSMKVCEKVESKGRTTYNEVADELVGEFSGTPPDSAPRHTALPLLASIPGMHPIRYGDAMMFPGSQAYLPGGLQLLQDTDLATGKPGRHAHVCAR